MSHPLYKWPVRGMVLAVTNHDTSLDFAEALVLELLSAGARLVVHVNSVVGQFSIRGEEEVSNVA